MSATIHHPVEYLFQFPIRVGGYLLIVLSGFCFFWGLQGIVFGLLMLLAGSFFSFSRSGIRIDPVAKKVMHYTRFGIFTRGKFRDYSTYPNLCVLPYKGSAFTAEEKEYPYAVYIVSRSFRGKALLYLASSKEDAMTHARDLADSLKVNFTNYNKEAKETHRNRLRIQASL